MPDHFTIRNRKIDLPRDLGGYPEISLETRPLTCSRIPTQILLKLLGDREIILYGVVTEICVDRTARGLIVRDYRVHLVEDAVLTSTRTVATLYPVCPAAWRSPAHHQ